MRKSNGARARRLRKPTPEEALQRTRELLDAHNEQARQVPAWRLLEGQAGAAPVPVPSGSPEVVAKQNELHLGETRAKAIQGSASIQDRRNQRRRDQR